MICARSPRSRRRPRHRDGSPRTKNRRTTPCRPAATMRANTTESSGAPATAAPQPTPSAPATAVSHPHERAAGVQAAGRAPTAQPAAPIPQAAAPTRNPPRRPLRRNADVASCSACAAPGPAPAGPQVQPAARAHASPTTQPLPSVSAAQVAPALAHAAPAVAERRRDARAGAFSRRQHRAAPAAHCGSRAPARARTHGPATESPVVIPEAGARSRNRLRYRFSPTP